MSGCTITAKVNAFNDYISNVSNRDRVMSIVQFVSMALSEPAARAGCPKLSRDLKTILTLTAQYRTITRFSQWFVVGPILSPHGMRDLLTNSATPLIGALKILCTALFTVFLFGEEVNLFAKYNIVSASIGKKFNRIRFVSLFWSNVVRLTMNYLILRESKFDAEKDSNNEVKVIDHKRKVLHVADGILMTMFAYTLLKGSVPAGPKYWPSALKSGDIVDVIACLAPPVAVVPSTPQGILGIIASIPGFQLSLL